MTAILIWIALPGAAAVLLYGLRRWPRVIYIAGVALALLLAWAAWQLPIGQPIPIRLWSGIPSARIEPAQTLFNSRFVLGDSARPALTLLYFSLAFWLGGSEAARTHRLFIPLGLAAAALSSAALAAENLAAAMLLTALAALVCLPVLSSPGEPARRGAVRFLVYMTAGTCLVLFADASMTGALASTTEELHADLRPTMLILALGFALILAVVPFHTWLPMLAEETNPYAAAFVFYLLPVTVSFLALDVLTRYSVSGLAPAMFTVLQYAGLLMVLTGGVGAAFERHLGRILGFGAITAMGLTVLAISLNDQLGRATPVVGIYFAQLVPQALGLALWGLALCILRLAAPGLDFRSVRGAGRSRPLAAAVVLLANLSLAGMPLLAGFPPNLALWSALAQTSLPVTLVGLLGCGALAAGALRSLAVLVMEVEEEPADPVRMEPALVQTRPVPAAARMVDLPARLDSPAADRVVHPAGQESGQIGTAEPAVDNAQTGQAEPAAAPAVGRVVMPPLALRKRGRFAFNLSGLRRWRLENPVAGSQPSPADPSEGDGRGEDSGNGRWPHEFAGRWQVGETRGQALLLALGVAALIVLGCFPQTYMPTLMEMAIIFVSGAP